MKIGIDGRGLTGIGRYTDNLVKNILRIDQENEYVLFLRPENYANYDPLPKNARKVKVDAAYYSFREQLVLPRAYRRERLDLMHFTHFSSPYFYSSPSVVTIHDLTVHYFPGQKNNSPLHQYVYRSLVRKAAWRARQIIAVSEHTKRDLHKLFGIDNDKISVVYEGAAQDIYKPQLDKQKTADITKKYGIDGPFMLYVGVWRNHKNLTGMIEALAILVEKYGFAGKLVITGKPDPKYPEVQRTIKKHRLDKKVVLTGFVAEEELPYLYNAARLFVFPSFYEGFGLPVLEALSCGLPVASSNTSSLPEVGGDAVAYFNPRDIKQMADVINLTFNDERIRAKLIDTGFKQIKKFSWEKMARQTLDIYRQAGKS